MMLKITEALNFSAWPEQRLNDSVSKFYQAVVNFGLSLISQTVV